jgi:hypothetical protein
MMWVCVLVVEFKYLEYFLFLIYNPLSSFVEIGIIFNESLKLIMRFIQRLCMSMAVYYTSH